LNAEEEWLNGVEAIKHNSQRGKLGGKDEKKRVEGGTTKTKTANFLC